MSKPHNLTNKRYGRITISHFSHKNHNGRYWAGICDCGNKVIALVQHLNNGHIKSCGCLSKEVARKTHTKHGMYNTPEYRAWIQMKSRCNNLNNTGYCNYGGRGISYSKRWDSFDNFIKDIGKMPHKNLSLGRINNEMNYSPKNCRWENRYQQNNNTRRNVLIKINNEKKTVFQWCRHFNIKPGTYYARIRSGMNPIEAMIKPVRKHNYHHPSTLE